MQKKLLIIGLVWPEPNSTAAGSRMLQLIDFFLSEKYEITFCSTAQETEYSTDLPTLGVQKKSIILNDDGFDGFIKELNPSIVLFDRFITEEQFGWRVAKHTPNAIRLLDTEDLHSLRATRQEAFKNKIDFTIANWLQNDITKREVASIYRSDCSLIISNYEMILLLNDAGIYSHLLLYLPFQLNEINTDAKSEWLSFEKRTDFVCIGNGKHAPNIDAFIWLKEEIWPLIRKQLPETKLNIYGAYLPQRILQLHKPTEGFYIHGRVEEAKKAIGQAKINLAPLRFGAGIKGKLVDSMLCGTPSVTTNIGAEGMHQNLPWNGAIESNPQAFANTAVALYQNKRKWKQAQENGVAIINKLYAKSKLNTALSAKLKAMEQNRESHRTKNFIGSIFLHQTMASTEYMSRWIAEKKRK